MEQFSTEVLNVLNNFQTICNNSKPSVPCVSISVQTEKEDPPKNTILPVNTHADSNIHNPEEFREKEGKFVKEIFELKVKLKEMEAKVSHLNKKAKAAKTVPRTEFIVEGPNKEEKVGLNK